MIYRSIRSAAGELRMPQSVLKRAILEGRIPAVKIRGVWRIPATYFEELEARAYSRVVREAVSPPWRPREAVYDEVDEDGRQEELVEEVFVEDVGDIGQLTDQLRWSA